MKKKTITLSLLILIALFSIGCSSKSSASADDAALQGTEEQAQLQDEGETAEEAEDYSDKTPEQLVEAGKDYLYARNGKTYKKETAIELLQKAADQGNGLACYYLGEAVQRSAESDRFEKALEYYEKAAAQGCDLGLLGKGDLMEYGRGMEHDSERARQLYEEALSNGCVDANIALGDYYRDGVGVDRDYVKALEYYQAFLDKEITSELDEDAYARIGNLYFDGIAGIDRDYQKAMEWFNKGRDAGKSTSIAEIGNMYLYGYGVYRDKSTAVTCYTEAAEMGDGYAMCKCGRVLISGLPDETEPDLEEAENWLILATAKGYPDAYYELGKLYLTNYYGFGSNNDDQITRGLGCYQLGIEKGSTACMLEMGNIYGFGFEEVSDENISTALDYFEQARAAGNLNAYSNIGALYANRLGDGMQAVEWYKKGAELGDSYCMYSLGSIYFNGFKGDVPVGQSMSTGREWYMKAAETGSVSAMVSLGNIHYFGYLGLLDVHKGHELFSEAAARGDGSAMWCIGHRYQGKSLFEEVDLREEVDRACYWYAKAMEVFGKDNSDWLMEYIDGLVLYTSLSQETADQIMQNVHENFKIG